MKHQNNLGVKSVYVAVKDVKCHKSFPLESHIPFVARERLKKKSHYSLLPQERIVGFGGGKTI